MIVPGEGGGILLPLSCVPRVMVMDETDTCIKQFDCSITVTFFDVPVFSLLLVQTLIMINSFSLESFLNVERLHQKHVQNPDFFCP